MTRLTRLLLAAALALGTAACGGGSDGSPSAEATADVSSPSSEESPSADPSGSPAAGSHRPRVLGTVATGLEAPWGLVFLPDGTALVSLRDSGEIKRLDGEGGVADVGRVPGVSASGEGGLLGLAVAPDFVKRPMVYAYLTTEADNRVVRMPYDGTDGLGKPEVILEGLKKADVHNGGQLIFGPDKMLYVGTGDAGMRELAQDDTSLNGKILRMTPDGEIPADNPDPESLIFTKGHRNVQGLVFDPQKRLWASEFGQDTTDELNYIRPGKNYGWPEVEGTDGLDRYANPVRTWSTDEASPSGITWAGGSVWLAALRGERLWDVATGTSITADDNPITITPRDWFEGEYGRLRTVAPAPDGTLWVMTNNTDGRGEPRDGDDRILRVEMGDIHKG